VEANGQKRKEKRKEVLMKLILLLRQPEEGFGDIDEVMAFLNMPMVRRIFTFFFGWDKAVSFYLYPCTLTDEPDQRFWAVVDLGNDREEGEPNGLTDPLELMFGE
jgi:hypothetical protein